MATCEVKKYEVIMILSNDILFGEKWRLFCRKLNFEQSIMHNLEKMDSSNTSISIITIRIIDYWVSMSPGEANPKTLSKVLREIGCVNSSSDIDDFCRTDLFEGKLARQIQNPNTCSTSQAAALHCNANTTEAELIWFNVGSPTKYYSGREVEMHKIEEQWKECEKQKRLLFVAITGLGGIGKSEIARNYAKIFHENVKGHCIWINAETDKAALKSFKLLAPVLKILLENKSRKVKTQEVLITEIYEKLSNKKCLLIFDNLGSHENPILSLLIKIAWKQTPTILKPFVLVTSRFRPATTFLGEYCINLELTVLSKTSAFELFSKSFNLIDKNSNPVDTVRLIEQLCERLHFYPLAMQQAAAYIKEDVFKSKNNLGKEITNYLENIEKESKNLLDHKVQREDGITNTTFLTWEITLDKIRKMPEIGGTAVKIMDIISLLSPDNISMDFLMKILERIKVELCKKKTCLQSLLQFVIRIFSIIFKIHLKNEFHKNSNPRVNKKSYDILRDHSMISSSENKISIHRLVQEVTKIRLSEKGQLTVCLDQLAIVIQQMLEDSEIPSDQIIHAETVWGHIMGNKEILKKHGLLPCQICTRFHNAGKYRELYEFCNQSLDVLISFLGERSRRTLTVKFWKGVALLMLGEYPESRDVLIEVYGTQKDVFGEDDKDSLITANGIGLFHRNMNNYNEAHKWYGDALERMIRLNGKEDSATLSIKNNIAMLLNAQGKYKEAFEMQKEILNVRQRVLGKEHLDTLSTKHNLAIVMYHLKKYEDAVRIFQEVLQLQVRVLELDHPSTLLTKGWIADSYECLRRMEEAFQLANEVYDKFKKLFGPSHQNTIISKNRLERLETTATTTNVVRNDQESVQLCIN